MPKRDNLTVHNKAEIVRRFYRGDKVEVIGIDYNITGPAVSNIVAREGARTHLRLQCPHCGKDLALTVKQDRVKYGRARDQ